MKDSLIKQSGPVELPDRQLLKGHPEVLKIRIKAVQTVLGRKTLPPDMRAHWSGVLKLLHPWSIEKQQNNPYGIGE